MSTEQHPFRAVLIRCLPGTPGTRTLSVLGLTMIYASCFIAIKAGLPFAPPLRFGGLRALIAGASLLALVVALRQPVIPRRQNWGWIVALGLISTTLAFGAMFLAPGRTGVGIASVLGNTQPLITIVLASMFLDERMTGRKWAALVLGVVGVAFISYRSLTGPEAFGLSGALLALSASGSAAIGSVIVKRMGTRDGLLAVTAWQLLLGSLPLLLVSALVEGEAEVIWNAQFVGLLLFLALVGTSFATAAWYWLLQRDEVGRLTMLLYLIPVVALGMAALVYGEGVGPVESVGVLLTLAGIGSTAWGSWWVSRLSHSVLEE